MSYSNYNLWVPYSSVEALNLLSQAVHLITELRPLSPKLSNVISTFLQHCSFTQL